VNTVSKNIINEGARLKEILRDRKITILSFASKAGFSNQIAHYYLRKESIKRTKLQEICALLDITLEEFYNWNNRPGAGSSAGMVHHGLRLSRLLEAKGFNKSEFARSLGLSRRGLYNLMERVQFKPKLIERIADLLDITTEEFLRATHFLDDGALISPDAVVWREKYYQLLEAYNQLLIQIHPPRQTNP
jgi:transcriptional regulator with XRE-family HTH domain